MGWAEFMFRCPRHPRVNPFR